MPGPIEGTPAEHLCLLCAAAVIPVYRTFCRHCFGLVPWQLRADVMYAHRFRLRNRAGYEQKLIELWQWAQGR